MYLQLGPTYTQSDFDAPSGSFRKTEQYELERMIREAEDAARFRRKAERKNRWARFFGPRTGHRQPSRERIRLVTERH